MKTSNFFKLNVSMRVTSFVTLAAFLFNIAFSDMSFGQTFESPLIKILTPSTFQLPENLGTVRDAWGASSSVIASDNERREVGAKQSPMIIHIQDAHCNYGCQKKISEIIEYLNKEYGVDTVNLEGGAKDYDLSIFTNIADKDLRNKVSDYFVKEGLVNGAEYYAINNPEKTNLWGVEDTKLYIDNLKTYRDSLKHKDKVDTYLTALTHELNNLKIKIYTKELFRLDTKYTQYKAGSMEFKDYLLYLTGVAKNNGLDISGLENISKLCMTMDEERKLNFKAANADRDSLIDILEKKLSKGSLEELVAKTVEFKTEKISQKEFYAYLIKTANMLGVSLSEFPLLEKYLAYTAMYDSIDKMMVMDELEALETKIKEKLYKNAIQKELGTLSKNLILLKNLFNISLTKEDYKYYKANEGAFDAGRYIAFIQTNIVGAIHESPLHADIATLDQHRRDMARFYEYSLERDEAFLKNIKYSDVGAPLVGARHDIRAGMKPAPTIIVTGGFHTENLCELFRKRGIAYISIMPNFKNCDGYECPYFKILSGKENVRIKDALPDVMKNVMQVASQLSPEMNRAVQNAYPDVIEQSARDVVSIDPLEKSPDMVILERIRQHEGLSYLFLNPLALHYRTWFELTGMIRDLRPIDSGLMIDILDGVLKEASKEPRKYEDAFARIVAIIKLIKEANCLKEPKGDSETLKTLRATIDAAKTHAVYLLISALRTLSDCKDIESSLVDSVLSRLIDVASVSNKTVRQEAAEILMDYFIKDVANEGIEKAAKKWGSYLTGLSTIIGAINYSRIQGLVIRAFNEIEFSKENMKVFHALLSLIWGFSTGVSREDLIAVRDRLIFVLDNSEESMKDVIYKATLVLISIGDRLGVEGMVPTVRALLTALKKIEGHDTRESDIRKTISNALLQSGRFALEPLLDELSDIPKDADDPIYQRHIVSALAAALGGIAEKYQDDDSLVLPVSEKLVYVLLNMPGDMRAEYQSDIFNAIEKTGIKAMPVLIRELRNVKAVTVEAGSEPDENEANIARASLVFAMSGIAASVQGDQKVKLNDMAGVLLDALLTLKGETDGVQELTTIIVGTLKYAGSSIIPQLSAALSRVKDEDVHAGLIRVSIAEVIDNALIEAAPEQIASAIIPLKNALTKVKGGGIYDNKTIYFILESLGKIARKNQNSEELPGLVQPIIDVRASIRVPVKMTAENSKYRVFITKAETSIPETLGKLGPQAMQDIIARLENIRDISESDNLERLMFIRALHRRIEDASPEEAVLYFEPLLNVIKNLSAENEANWTVLREAASAIGTLVNKQKEDSERFEEAVDVLLNVIRISAEKFPDKPNTLRASMFRTLGAIGLPSLDKLMDILLSNSENDLVREDVGIALAYIKEPAIASLKAHLIELAGDRKAYEASKKFIEYGMKCLARFTPEKGGNALVDVYNSAIKKWYAPNMPKTTFGPADIMADVLQMMVRGEMIQGNSNTPDKTGVYLDNNPTGRTIFRTLVECMQFISYKGVLDSIDNDLKTYDTQMIRDALGISYKLAVHLKKHGGFAGIADPKNRARIDSIADSLNREKTLHPAEPRLGEDEKTSLLSCLLRLSESKATRAEAMFDKYFRNNAEDFQINIPDLVEILNILPLDDISRIVRGIGDNRKAVLDEMEQAVKQQIESSEVFKHMEAEDRQRLIKRTKWFVENLFVLRDKLGLLAAISKNDKDSASLTAKLIKIQKADNCSRLVVIANEAKVKFNDIFRFKMESLGIDGRERLLIDLISILDKDKGPIEGSELKETLYNEFMRQVKALPNESRVKMYAAILARTIKDDEILRAVILSMSAGADNGAILSRAGIEPGSYIGRYLLLDGNNHYELDVLSTADIVRQDPDVTGYFTEIDKLSNPKAKKAAFRFFRDVFANDKGPNKQELAQADRAIQDGIKGLQNCITVQGRDPSKIPHVLFEALVLIDPSDTTLDILKGLISALNKNPDVRNRLAALKEKLNGQLSLLKNLRNEPTGIEGFKMGDLVDNLVESIAITTLFKGLKAETVWGLNGKELIETLLSTKALEDDFVLKNVLNSLSGDGLSRHDVISALVNNYLNMNPGTSEEFYNRFSQYLDEFYYVLNIAISANAQIFSSNLNSKLKDLSGKVITNILLSGQIDNENIAALKLEAAKVELDTLMSLFREKIRIEDEDKLLDMLSKYTRDPRFKWTDHDGKNLYYLIQIYLNTQKGSYYQRNVDHDVVFQAIYGALTAEMSGVADPSTGINESFKKWKYSSPDYAATLQEIREIIIQEAINSLPEDQRTIFSKFEGETLQAKLESDMQKGDMSQFKTVSHAVESRMAEIMRWEDTISGSVENLPGYTVEFTDDFYTLFNIGNSAHFSACQSCTYQNDLNSGLSGYVSDGTNKAVVLLDENRRPVVRRIVRLRIIQGPDGKKRPVMFVEESTQFGSRDIEELYRVLDKVSQSTKLPIILSMNKAALSNDVQNGQDIGQQGVILFKGRAFDYSDTYGWLMPHSQHGLYHMEEERMTITVAGLKERPLTVPDRDMGNADNMTEHGPQGAARKGLAIDTDDLNTKLGEGGYFEALRKYAANVTDAKKGKIDGIDYRVVYYKNVQSDEVNALFMQNGIEGAYTLAPPEGTPSEPYTIFIQKGLDDKDERQALEHETLEIKWLNKLAGKTLPAGITIQRAAHILAWAEQISKNKWTKVTDCQFLEKQLNGLSQSELEKILNPKEPREGLHHFLVGQELGPDALKVVTHFEGAVKRYARSVYASLKINLSSRNAPATFEGVETVLRLLSSTRAKEAMLKMSKEPVYKNVYIAARHLILNGTKNVEKVLNMVFGPDGKNPQEEYMGELVSAYAMECTVQYSRITTMSEERFGSEIDFVLDVNRAEYPKGEKAYKELEDGAYIVESKTEVQGTDLDVILDQLLANDMPETVTVAGLMAISGEYKRSRTKLENYCLNALRMKKAYEKGDISENVVGIIFAISGEAVNEKGIKNVSISELEAGPAIEWLGLTISEADIPDTVIDKTEEKGKLSPKELDFVNYLMSKIDESKRNVYFDKVSDAVMRDHISLTQFKIADLMRKVAPGVKRSAQTSRHWEAVFDSLLENVPSEVSKTMVSATASVQDVKNARKNTDLNALTSNFMDKGEDVVVVVGVPEGVEANAVISKTMKALNDGLQNNVGARENNKQIVTFKLDENAEKNQGKAMESALNIAPNARIVLFSPQMENGPKLADKAMEVYKDGRYIVVPDGYSDTDTAKAIPPDMMLRVALGRNMALCKKLDEKNLSSKEAFENLKTLLSKVASNDLNSVTDLAGLLAALTKAALKIAPINWTDIREWQEAQESIAISV